MATHGSSNRGLEAGAMPDVGFGRFGRMFDLPAATKLPRAALEELAAAMIKVDRGKGITDAEMIDENPTVAAGYTYFGPFVDHDLTLDTTPFSITSASSDISAMVDFRTPALDLDCVYGRGPDDQPYMYDGLKLRVGRRMLSGGATIGTKNDLLRLSSAPQMPDDGRDGVAVLGDKRNDENKIVSQLHGAMIAFHNKVVGDDALLMAFGGDISSPTARFRTAATLVRWHYQWVVANDYIDQVCEPGMKNEVLNPGGEPRLINYQKDKATYAYIPVEFSGAAFRFGHSMVRPSYALNIAVGTTDPKTRIALFSRDPNNNLNGFPGVLRDGWGIDWGYFLNGAMQANVGAGFKVPQPSYRIDALLVDPLADLPEFRDQGSPFFHLAFRNLDRGQMLGLPSGQAVASKLGIVPLSDEVLWDAGSSQMAKTVLDDGDMEDFKKVRDARQAMKAHWVDGNGGILKDCTPLWYYILREAEYYGVTKDFNEPGVGLGGQHLGPVGSRIVAETLIGLLWNDVNSYLHDTRGFRPMPQIAVDPANFTLDQLIAYALT